MGGGTNLLESVRDARSSPWPFFLNFMQFRGRANDQNDRLTPPLLGVHHPSSNDLCIRPWAVADPGIP